MMEDTLKLTDGRLLAYGIYGNRNGFPILDFHGIPGTRREAALIEKYLAREDTCFIGLDRPGYGHSSPKPNSSQTTFSADVRALLDHLGIECFAALGYSGGGPYALACATQMPSRMTALALVSSLGPPEIGAQDMIANNREKFNLARRMPWLARLMLWWVFSSLRRDPERLKNQLQKIWQQMPAPDLLVLQQDQFFADSMLAITYDALSLGVSGWVKEEVMATQPWGFDPRTLGIAHVQLWHGGMDHNVPVAMGQALAAQIPGCQVRILPEEGHISLLYKYGQEIVATLIQTGFHPTSS
jgi:pimeloyl-ACP methyl ester carboxylesterase